MHRMRTAAALLLVTVLAAGCVQNMAELKIALGAEAEPAEALPPQPPVARAMAFPTTVKVGEEVLFTAAGSGDPEGRQVQHLWNFNDGTRADGEEVRHAFLVPGLYRVELTVSDLDGLWDAASVEVTVLPGNAPPSAAIEVLDARGAPAERATPGAALTFRAKAADPEGGALAFAWDFGDGAAATEREAKHAYAVPGRYAITLRVTDPVGAVARATASVAVDARAAGSGVLAAGDPPAVVAFPGGPGARLHAVLAYDAGFGANDLALEVRDAEGALVGVTTLKPGATSRQTNETIELGPADLAKGAPGEWRAVVKLASGARVPWALELVLAY